MSNEHDFEVGQDVLVKANITEIDDNYIVVNIKGLHPVWLDASDLIPAAPTPQFNNGDWVENLSGNRWTVVVDTTKQRYHLSRVNEHGDTERRVWTYAVGHEYFTKI